MVQRSPAETDDGVSPVDIHFLATGSEASVRRLLLFGYRLVGLILHRRNDVRNVPRAVRGLLYFIIEAVDLVEWSNIRAKYPMVTIIINKYINVQWSLERGRCW